DEHYNIMTEQFEFTFNSRIQFKKYSQKNNQGSKDNNLNTFIVPILSNSEDC
ncbi:5796_t:CDS:1, partial [Scutellospora calospora]